MEECRRYRSCKYGAYLGEGYSYCKFMLMTGKSRLKDPKGEIVNGKCGYYVRKRTGKKDQEED